MSADDIELAEQLRTRISVRLGELGLTPITAATKAGLPRDTLRNLFRGVAALPRIDTLTRIASALETSVAYLVGETAYAGLDYDEADRLAAARLALEVARPIPVLGYAEWGRFEPMPEGGVLDPVDYLHFNVPGFEDQDLMAVIVNDDHCKTWFSRGEYLVVAHRDDIGVRDGDIVLVAHNKGQKMELTARQQFIGMSRAPSGAKWMSGGFLSLAEDREKYPDWTRYGGSRSTVFPAEPPSAGWGKHAAMTDELRAAIEAGEIPGITHDYEVSDDGEGDPPFESEFLQVFGVVVATASFLVRPAGPALRNVQGLSSRDTLDVMPVETDEAG